MLYGRLPTTRRPGVISGARSRRSTSASMTRSCAKALLQQRHEIAIDLDHRYVIRSGDQMTRQRTLARADLEHGIGARIRESFRHRFEDGFARRENAGRSGVLADGSRAREFAASSIAATKLPMSTPPRPARSSAVP